MATVRPNPPTGGVSFPREIVLAYLSRSLGRLQELNAQRQQRHQDRLAEAISRATILLQEIKSDYKTAAQPDARKLEESLTGLERMLDDAIRNAITEIDIAAARADIDTQLKPYKRHMDKAVFVETRDNLLRKQLREHFGIPRLSLFFLRP